MNHPWAKCIRPHRCGQRCRSPAHGHALSCGAPHAGAAGSVWCFEGKRTWQKMCRAACSDRACCCWAKQVTRSSAEPSCRQPASNMQIYDIQKELCMVILSIVPGLRRSVLRLAAPRGLPNWPQHGPASPNERHQGTSCLAWCDDNSRPAVVGVHSQVSGCVWTNLRDMSSTADGKAQVKGAQQVQAHAGHMVVSLMM